MTRQRDSSRGTILIQVAIIMGVLLGFTALTTDYGLLVLRQRNLQKGVDAAALSAGPDVGDSSAEAEAVLRANDYAAANRIPVESVAVRNGPTDLPRTITVTSRDSVPTIFARVLDPLNRSNDVGALATVAAYPVSEAWRLRPWGIPYAFFNKNETGAVRFDEPATLALTKNTDEVPNGGKDNQTFVNPLDLGRSEQQSGSYKDYVRNCSSGYDQPMRLGARSSVVMGHPGDLQSLTDATEQGVKSGADSIFSQAEGSAFQDNSWENPGDSPRLVILPVIDQMKASGGPNGEKCADVIGFAAFYIESMSGNEIHGRFIHYSLKYNNRNPKVLDPDSYNYGLYTFHLIK